MSVEELRGVRYWSEAQGRRAVALWRKSGEPLSVFAARTGLGRARLQYWANDRDRPESRGVALASVTVVPSSRPTVSSISIELRSGRAIRIEGDFDDDVLARAIMIAERAAC